MAVKTEKADESIGFLINRAARGLSGALKRGLHEHGIDLSAEQFGLLRRLAENDGQVQQNLASNWCKDKTSIARLLNGMENRHLIVRIGDKSDRRVKRIYMTKDGSRLFEKCLPIATGILSRAACGFSDKEANLFRLLLERLYRNLSSEPDDGISKISEP